MKIPLPGGGWMEPVPDGPTIFTKKILRTVRRGLFTLCFLECGHRCRVIGDPALLGGKVECELCRERRN